MTKRGASWIQPDFFNSTSVKDEFCDTEPKNGSDHVKQNIEEISHYKPQSVDELIVNKSKLSDLENLLNAAERNICLL